MSLKFSQKFVAIGSLFLAACTSKPACPPGYVASGQQCLSASIAECQSDQDCPALTNADSKCENLRCRYQCRETHLDCNDDLKAQLSDGCEARRDAESNCGTCDQQCDQNQFCKTGAYECQAQPSLLSTEIDDSLAFANSGIVVDKNGKVYVPRSKLYTGTRGATLPPLDDSTTVWVDCNVPGDPRGKCNLGQSFVEPVPPTNRGYGVSGAQPWLGDDRVYVSKISWPFLSYGPTAEHQGVVTGFGLGGSSNDKNLFFISDRIALDVDDVVPGQNGTVAAAIIFGGTLRAYAGDRTQEYQRKYDAANPAIFTIEGSLLFVTPGTSVLWTYNFPYNWPTTGRLSKPEPDSIKFPEARIESDESSIFVMHKDRSPIPHYLYKALSQADGKEVWATRSDAFNDEVTFTPIDLVYHKEALVSVGHRNGLAMAVGLSAKNGKRLWLIDSIPGSDFKPSSDPISQPLSTITLASRAFDTNGNSSGTLWICGDFVGTLQFPGTAPLTSSGMRDAFIAMISPAGEITHLRGFGSSDGDDYCWGLSARDLESGEHEINAALMVSGKTFSLDGESKPGGRDWLVRYTYP